MQIPLYRSDASCLSLPVLAVKSYAVYHHFPHIAVLLYPCLLGTKEADVVAKNSRLLSGKYRHMYYSLMVVDVERMQIQTDYY